MDKHSDLILDSKLDSRFESGFTIHTYRQVPNNSKRRVVIQREEHWLQISQIGSGTYGSVWLEKCVKGYQGDELRAVKRVSTRPLRSGRLIDYSQELKAVAKFSHDKYVHSFVKSFGWYEREDALFIAMEYLPHGDLEQYLSRMPPLLEEAASDVIYQILEGLSYMHENRFAHRDLKPGNILIQSCPPQEWWVKIGDFGISKRLEGETAQSTLLKGTRGFIAPELYGFTLAGTSFAADMWSLGEITFQLMTKQPVFENECLLAGYAMQSHRFPSTDLLTQNVSTLGQDFISSLMLVLPEMRLTTEAALKHQWIASYLSLTVQPSPSSQTTGGLPATDLMTEASASWNSLSISDSPPPDLAKTLRPKRSRDHQSPYYHNLRPSETGVVRGQVAPTKKLTYYIGRLSGHTADVYSVAFSPNGATIASGSGDESVRIWDASTGQQLRELSGHTNAVSSVAFSPDGSTIASGSWDKSVRIWNAGTGKQLQELSGHTGMVYSVAFSPNGATIASGSCHRSEVSIWDNRGSVRIWDASTGQQLRELTGHTDDVGSVVFSPNGATIASSGSWDKSVRIWDASTGQQLRELCGHTDVVSSVAFSPDGDIIASAAGSWCGNRSVRIWDASTGRQLRELSGHTDTVDSVAFSPDGATFASGSGDESVRIWDVSTGKQLRKLSGHADTVYSVAFSPDGTTIASIASGAASGPKDRLVRIWDAGTGKQLRELSGHADTVYSVAFSPNGAIIASGSGDESVRIWDADTGKQLRELSGHTGRVSSVTFSPDGSTIASGSWDKSVRIWDAGTGKQLRELSGHTGRVSSVAFSPDGVTIASGLWGLESVFDLSGSVRIWDASTGQQLRELSGHTGRVSSVTFSPDGSTIASGSWDKSVRIWDAGTGKQLRELSGHTGRVESVVFSPNGATIASGSGDESVRIWDADTGKQLRKLSGHTGTVESVVFSPDGATIASGSWDKSVRIWDAGTGKQLRELSGNTGRVSSVAFSPDGATIASGSEDWSVRIWEVAT